MTELLQKILNSSLLQTKEASDISGYNSDYLARLCREGKIQGQQVGRSWLINRESLEAFVLSQGEKKRERSEELRAAREKEYRRAQKPILRAIEKSAVATKEGIVNTFASEPIPSPFAAPASYSRPLVACAISLLVVAGGAYASTNAAALQALASLPEAAVRFALVSAPASDSSFRVTEVVVVEEREEARVALRVPKASEVSEAFALTGGRSASASIASVRALTDEARAPFSETETARVAEERIALAAFVVQHPVQSALYAYVMGGMHAYSTGALVGDVYLATVEDAGDVALATAGTTRDVGALLPTASNAIIDGYVDAVYAWNDLSPKIAGTAIMALYETGNATGGVVAAAPDVAEVANDTIARGVVRATLALSEAEAPAPLAAAEMAVEEAPDAPAPRTPSRVAATASDIYTSIVNAERVLIEVPVRAENTMLGLAGYTASIIDGVELPSGAAASASAISFLPDSSKEAISGFFATTNTFARSFFSSSVRSMLALLPGGSVMTPALTVVDVTPGETLALPSFADSLTQPNGSGITNNSSGSIAQTIVNNYFPQVFSGGSFDEAVLAIVRPFVYKNINASLDSDRGGNSGGGGGGDVNSDGATLTNVTISSGTAILSTLTADSGIFDSLVADISDLGTTTVDTLTSGSTTVGVLTAGTTTISGDLTVTGTITGGALSVDSLTSNGGIVAPFFTATSTTATSTFTNVALTNLDATNATTTNFYSTVARAVDGFFDTLTATVATITNATFTNSTTTNATTTNFYATQGTFGSLISPLATITNAVITNLTGTNATTTNATSTNLYATNGTFGSLIGTLATIGDAVFGSFTATNGTTTNATSTNLYATNGTLTNATSTNLFATNAVFTGATTTSLTTTNLGLGGQTFTSLLGTGLVNTAGVLTVSTSSLGLDTSYFKQGGNTFGAAATIGTLDANAVNIITNNAVVATFDTSGFLGLGTTSPSARLSVSGNALISGGLTASTLSAGSLTTTGNANVNSLTIGSLSGFLKATAGVVSTSLIDLSTDVSSTLATANGGTGITSYTAGDVLYADSMGVLTKLPAGFSGQVLKIAGGLPMWGQDQTVGAGGNDGIFATSTNLIYPVETGSTLVIGTGATSTNGSIFEVNGQAYVSTRLAIGTTSPMVALSIGSGQVAVQPGTAGAPGLAFANDLTTGLYSTGAGNLSLGAGGSAGLSLSSSAITYSNAFISTNSNGVRLSNASSLSATTPVIVPNRQDNTTGFGAGTLGNINVIVGGVETARWTSTGFGIGTSSPFAKLSVAGDTYIGGNLTATGTATFANIINNGVTADTLMYANGSKQLSSVTLGTGLSLSSGALTIATSSLYTGTTGQIPYFSGTNTLTATSSVFLAANGFVGIGTTSPQATLHVAGSDPAFRFERNGFFTLEVVSTSGTAEIYSTGAFNNNLLLQASSAGNVGIGTTSPARKLSVQGSAIISGDLALANLTATGTVSTANLTVGTLNGPLQANNGVVSATTSVGVLYGGTGLTSVPTYGQLLVGNGTGYTLTATSTLGIALGDTTGVLAISRGGTNASSQTTNGIAYFNGSSLTTGSSFTFSGTDVELTGGAVKAPQFQATDSVNAPGFSWANDATTGMYRHASNIIGFATGGVGRVYIDGAGYLGVGTTSPMSTLSVEGDARITGALSLGSISGVLYGNNGAVTSAATSTPTLGLGISYSGTLGAFVGGSSGSFSVATSSLYSGTTGQVPYFSGTNTLTATSSIYLATSGNVGIGATTPGAKLNVFGGDVLIDGSALPTLTLDSSGGSSGTFSYSGSSQFILNNANAGTDIIHFQSGGSDKVVINSSGNVGIGTTSPYAKLSVVGQTVSEYFTATSTSATSTLPNLFATNLRVSGKLYDGLNVAGTNGQILQATGSGVQWMATSSLGLATAAGTAGQVAYFSGSSALTGTAGFTFDGSNFAVPGTITAGSQFIGIGGSGTAGVPSYTFASDLTTGIFHPQNNVMAFSTGGVERLRIDGNGYLAIGTTTGSAALSVEGDAFVNNIIPNGPYTNNLSAYSLGNSGARWAEVWADAYNIGTSTFSIKSNAQSNLGFYTAASGAGTQAMTLTSAGNVGIGTSSPGTLLSVAGNANFLGTGSRTVKIGRDGGTLLQLDASVTAGGAFVSTMTASPLTLRTNGLAALTIDTNQNVGIGTTSPAATLHVNRDSSAATAFLASRSGGAGSGFGIDFNSFYSRLGSTNDIRFFTGMTPEGSFTSATERFTILTAGNVGIGTTSPTQVLDVNGSIALRGGYSSSASVILPYTTGSFVQWGNASDAPGLRLNGGLNLNSDSSNPDIIFNQRTGASSYTELMRIKSTGNVGIGTTTPGQKLSVAGDILGNNIIGSYFTSTSTSATSTLAGGFSAASSLYVLQGGNVGIGTASPTTKLDVSGSIRGTGTATFGVGLINGISIGGSSVTNAAVFGTSANQDVNVAANGTGSVKLLTGADSSGLSGATERFRITSAGLVGIGTTTPGTNLEVSSAGNTYSRVTRVGGASTDIITTATLSYIGTNNNYPLGFLTNNTERVRIDVSGNVGIGTTSPGSTLSVAGNGYFTGTLMVAGALTLSPTATSTIGGNSYGPDGINLGVNDKIYSSDQLSLYDTTNGLNRFSFSTNNSYVTSASGQHRFNVAGTQVAVITSTGNLGIGEAAPGSKLSVSGGTTIGASYDTTAAPTNGLLVEGNVGIGTTTPQNLLSLSSNASTIASIDSTLTSGSSRLYFTENGTLRNYFQSLGSAFATTDRQNDLEIFGAADINFFTAATNRLSITSAGNVGIGTSTPQAGLHLDGSYLRVTSSLGYGASFINSSGLGSYITLADQGNSSAVGTSNGALVFYTNTNTTERARITSAGNFGIATATPWGLLSVNPNSIGAGPAFVVGSSTGTSLIVTNAGNVGIGTTTPGALLAVAGNTYITGGLGVGFLNTTAGTAAFGAQAGGNTSITGGGGDAELRLNWTTDIRAGIIGNAFAWTNATGLTAAARFGTGNGSNYAYIGHTGGSNANLIINPVAGNVGIGTTTPGQKLSVAGDILGNNIIGSYFTATTSTATSSFVGGAVFATGGGNVGIGTASPGKMLTVNGAMSFLTSGTLRGLVGPPSWDGGYMSFQNGTLTESAANSAINQSQNGTTIVNAASGQSINFRIGNDSSLGAILSSAGNFGVGTTSPYAKLSVTNTSSGPSFLVEDDTSPDSTPFIIDASGSVGIGTTVLPDKLNVIGAARFGDGTNFVGISADATGSLVEAAAGAATFRINTNGSERLRITSTGNVGIGTTTPVNALEVTGAAASPASSGSAQNGITRLSATGGVTKVLDTGITAGASGIAWLQVRDSANYASLYNLSLQPNGGYVGIGTTTPAAILHVQTSNREVARFESTSSGGPVINLYKSGVQSGILEYDSVNTFYIKNNINGGLLSFQTNGGSGTQDRLTITSAGNVGIGTTTPDAPLNVVKFGSTRLWTSSTASIAVFDRSTAASSASSLTLVSGNTGLGRLNFGDTDAESRGIVQYDHSLDSLSLWTAGSQKFTIDTSGNVGIGTTTAQQELSISSNGITGLVMDSTAGTAENRIQFQFDGATNAGIINIQEGASMLVGTQASLPLAFQTGGTERIRIDTSGNVGIGTTSPAATLHVNRDSSAATAFLASRSGGAGSGFGIDFNSFYSRLGSTNDIRFFTGMTPEGSFTPATERFTILTAGNVGIGTSTPSSLLELSANSNVVQTFTSAVSGGGTLGGITFNGSRGTIGAQAVVVAGDIVGKISYNTRAISAWSESAYSQFVVTSVGSSVTNGYLATYIKSSSDGVARNVLNIQSGGGVGIGDQNSSIPTNTTLSVYNARASTGISRLYVREGVAQSTNEAFGVYANDGTTPRLVVQGGNVGIGTTTPDAKLVVAGSGQSTANLSTSANLGATLVLSDTNVGGASGSGGMIIFGGTGSGGQLGRYAAIKGLLTNSSSNSVGDLAFSTRNAIADATLTERLRITSGGNVGIGTTSPQYALTVAGQAQFTDFKLRQSNALEVLSTTAGSGGGTKLYAPETNGVLQFFTSGTAAGNERVRIDSNGNLGIGTTTPMGTLSIGTGQLILQNGSASTPALGFADEPGNGIYRPSSAVFAVAINGGARFAVNASNYAYTSSNGLFGFTSSTGLGGSVDTNISRVSAGVLGVGTGTQGSTAGTLLAGTVGIGTTSPSSKLHVYTGASGNTAHASFDDLVVETSGIGGITILSSASSYGGFVFGDSGSPDVGGVIYNHTADSMGLKVAGSDRVTILSSGNVGIGTTTPSSLLETYATTNNTLKITTSGSNTYVPKLSLNRYADTAWNLSVISGASDFTIDQDGARMFTIKGSTGNVGIGTTTPWRALSVNGSSDLGVNALAGSLTATSSATSSIASILTVGSVNLLTALPPRSLIVGEYSVSNSPVARFEYQNGSGGIEIIGAAVSGSYINFGRPASISVGQIQYSHPTDEFRFTTNSSQKAVLTSGGSFGIATTSPATTLSVGGSAYVTTGLGVGVLNTSGGTIQTTGDVSVGQVSGGNRTLTINSSGTYRGILSHDGSSFIIDGGIANQTLKLGTSASTVFSHMDFNLNGNASGDFGFLIGGTERFTIASTGFVGVGTTTPWGQLSVNPNGLGAAPAFVVGSSTGTNFIVTNAGKVGIGTTAFVGSIKLAVNGQIGGPTFSGTYLDVSGGTPELRGNSGIGYYSSGGSHIFYGGSSVEMARITTTGNVGIGTTTPWGLLSINPNGITGPAFVVGSSTGTKLIVTNGGKVGIGTVAPSALLSVGSTSQFTVDDTGTLNMSGAQGSAYISTYYGGYVGYFANPTPSNTVYLAESSRAVVGSVSTYTGSLGNSAGSAGGLSAGYFTDGTNEIELANGTSALNVITGSVGIGTSTPTTQFGGKLAVAGPIYVGGASTTATSTIEGNLRVIGNLAVGSGTTWIRDNATSTFSGGIAVSGGIVSNSLSPIDFRETGVTTSDPAALADYTRLYIRNLVATSSTATTTVAYSYTGSNQTFTVPDGTSFVQVKMWGAGGGGATSAYGGGAGGAGGYAVAAVPVTPGEAITVRVGGGGSPGSSTYGGGGGGGRSDILRGTGVVLVAGAGGGGGNGAAGGAGGGSTGVTGTSGGTGGTSGSGGAAGSIGSDGGGNGGAGSLTTGTAGGDSSYDGGGGGGVGGGGGGSASGPGAGGSGTFPTGGAGGGSASNLGGGGGGGGYGGGGGGDGLDGGSTAGGGGGGAAFASSTATSNATLTAGSGTTPGNSADSDRGTAGNGGATASTGGDGRIVISYRSLTNATTTNFFAKTSNGVESLLSLWAISTTSTTSTAFYLKDPTGDNSSRLGIGTQTPSAQLHTTGTVRFATFGAGTLSTDSNGNLSVSSDERLKSVDGAFTRGLDAIMGLSPISYHWNAASGLDTENSYSGFSAQNVQMFIPEAVDMDKRGFLTLSDRPILAASINAIKELASSTMALSMATTTLGSRIDTLDSTLASTTVSLPGTLTADRIVATSSISAPRYLAPSTIAEFTIGSTTISADAPSEALTANGEVDIYKFASYNLARIQDLASTTALLSVKIDDIESRLAALETLNGAAAGVTESAKGAVGLTVATIKDALASIGIVIKQGYVAVGALVTNQLVLVTGDDGTSATGSEFIALGTTEIEVDNALVRPTSKIFITFTSSVDGAWHISEKKDGSFTVKLAQAQSAAVEFDYFILQTEEGALAAVGASQPSEEPPLVSENGEPLIALNGNTSVQIAQGASWIDPGAYAVDAEGTDISASVVVTGAVDTEIAGTYTLTYRATDAAGNFAEATRSVAVLAPSMGGAEEPPAEEPPAEPEVTTSEEPDTVSSTPDETPAI